MDEEKIDELRRHILRSKTILAARKEQVREAESVIATHRAALTVSTRTKYLDRGLLEGAWQGRRFSAGRLGWEEMPLLAEPRIAVI